MGAPTKIDACCRPYRRSRLFVDCPCALGVGLALHHHPGAAGALRDRAMKRPTGSRARRSRCKFGHRAVWESPTVPIELTHRYRRSVLRAGSLPLETRRWGETRSCGLAAVGTLLIGAGRTRRALTPSATAPRSSRPACPPRDHLPWPRPCFLSIRTMARIRPCPRRDRRRTLLGSADWLYEVLLGRYDFSGRNHATSKPPRRSAIVARRPTARSASTTRADVPYP